MDCVCWLLLIASLFTVGINLQSPTRINGILGKPHYLSLEPTETELAGFDTVQVKLVVKEDTKQTIFCCNVARNETPVYGGHLQNHSRFHPENLSLEIYEITRQNAGFYVVVWTKGHVDKENYLQLDVYEQISASSIPVTKMLENETCTMLLNCTVEKGDNVTYNWTQRHGNITRQLAHNASILTITPAPGDTSLSYDCMAKNPVSQSYHVYNPWTECYPSALPSEAGLLAPIVAVPVVLIALIIGGVVFCWRYKQRQMARSNLCLNEETQPERTDQGRTEIVNTPDIFTIYSAVERPMPTNNVPHTAENHESLTVYELAWPPQASSALTSATHPPNYNSCRPGGPGPKESLSCGPNL
ncbi:signaling lymphocytic activation molecule isoform X2 [Microcaecilia unicolor]|uniref:Signaling lymphocytic activation molecule isoform X2 n=1 Tax=Microcaecilia unicolor TaxID=1415580 RepID=A0A6P7WSE1_9AMPH|nr:signaling lymphocytic activation molecule isoform X2 [Microcaecilia unicolor]